MSERVSFQSKGPFATSGVGRPTHGQVVKLLRLHFTTFCRQLGQNVKNQRQRTSPANRKCLRRVLHHDQPHFSREFNLTDVIYVYAICSIHPIRSEGFDSSLTAATCQKVLQHSDGSKTACGTIQDPMFRLCFIESQLS